MRAAVFVGPTLCDDPILKSRAFEWHPPAAQGDVYRVARTKAGVIGLIDGRFETLPSVWHKEILWALARGIHVYGAASMGALRAAELARFGMVGVGSIYRDFQSGMLQDDDEVAVLHAPGDLRHQPLTEAMVDIRATIAAAQSAKIISGKSALSLLGVSKAAFFKDRTWDHILKQAAHARLPKVELARLARWLPANRVEQKRRDAHSLLRAIQRLTATRPNPFRPRFAFQPTMFWQALMDSHKG